ncbi:MAG: tRNA (N(6)-L-threonylcarbamoyladenosine(37)-C(2))-methylthiotransferase MtaB [Roseburia sp.]|nr:tRNA (N(6)-L-threonylcarbamoyladenosine(37)-C(2))-methylthiotransferase MtaB [Roseburia sp.]
MESLKIRVITLGCKVNQCESASIVAALAERGYDASEGYDPADVYVLNTCSVTAEADRKSRQHISKLTALNPDCRIIIVGCSSQNQPKQYEKNNVTAIGGTANKTEFVLNAVDELQYYKQCSILNNRILFDKNIENVGKNDVFCCEMYPKSDKTRAFIKIQDGCNRFCSYCIIPYLRGRSRSRTIDDIVCECEQTGSREIVLTGIDISEYGKDIGTDLNALLRALGKIDARKRLGSIECEIVNDEMLEIMGECGYCPHFHLSLQSGSDEVLRSMNRRYTCDYFASKVDLIRKYFPLAGITTDVIAGFPAETDELFENSVRFIEHCEFSDIHVFPYSSRAGTLAAKKYAPLPKDVVKQRTQRLLDVKMRSKMAFLQKNLGETAEVYAETRYQNNGLTIGYTPNYIAVYSDTPCGNIKILELCDLFCDGILGKLV